MKKKSLQSSTLPIRRSEQSFAAIARRQFLRNRLAVGGLIVVIILATIAVWCPLIATDKPYMIFTVFDEEYQNAYYASMDLLGRCEELGREQESQLQSGMISKDFREAGQLLRARLEEMESSLPTDARRKTTAVRSGVSDFFKNPVKAGREGVSWGVWKEQLAQIAHPDRVQLVPKRLFPAFRSLGPIEIFFMVLWIAALGIWATGFWRKGFYPGLLVLGIPALVLGGVWRVVNPPISDTKDYRSIIEHPRSRVQYIRAPIPYGENENLTSEANHPPTWAIKKPSPNGSQTHNHWLGTDPNGRDVLGRMVYGTRISMLIGIVAVGIYISIGIFVGSLAGYFRGWIDIAISRLIEIVICFPTLFLLLILLAYLRPNIYTIMAVLGLISWTGVARLERGEFLRLGNQDFVLAVRALGGSNFRIIFRHILPNALGPILVSASFGIAGSILAESTLSFLGFGVPSDQASWGGLLKIGNERIQELWWMVVFPGISLFTTVTCFNLVGEGIRDATDPRLIQ